jgi:hypothetical protein
MVTIVNDSEENNLVEISHPVEIEAKVVTLSTRSTNCEESSPQQLHSDHADAICVPERDQNRLVDAMAREDDIEELVEALRRGAFDQLRLAERLSVQLAVRDAARPSAPALSPPWPMQPVPPRGELPKPAPVDDGNRVRTVDKDDNVPYVSRTPFGTTKKYTLEYLQGIAPKMAGPTEIIKNTKNKTGITMTYATVARAIDELIDENQVEKADRSRWRATSSKIRSVT